MDKPKAIVIEDNPHFSKYLGIQLKNCGFQVFHITSGDELDSLMDAHRPDLVTVDWAIEGERDGMHCIEVIKKWDAAYIRNPETPILVISGIDSSHGQKHARKKGAHGFLSKAEITSKDIKNTITEIMQKINPDCMPEELRKN